MRARNIKPGFFKNENLVECSLAARLLAPGLWMLADKEGRLHDKPKQIKMEIFPADMIDVEPLLNELSIHKHILRYEVNGVNYIQIIGFTEHQSPHYTERDSIIPSPFSKKDENIISSSEKILVVPPPDSLIPDSLIPDSLCKDADNDYLPVWINSDLWDSFMEVRKNKKAQNTTRAKKTLIGKLEAIRKKGYDPNKLIEEAVINSWKSVYEPRNSQPIIKQETKANVTVL